MTSLPSLFLIASLVASPLLGGPADWAAVEPVLAERCYSCHGGEKTKGGVDLQKFAADPDLEVEFDLWGKVLDTIEAGDMPPKKATPLNDTERKYITGWVRHSLDALAEARSGDPGPVTMRRLTNAEYDNSLRDLTGQDLRLAGEFQPDGGGGEGFANTGDTLLLIRPSLTNTSLPHARSRITPPSFPAPASPFIPRASACAARTRSRPMPSRRYTSGISRRPRRICPRTLSPCARRITCSPAGSTAITRSRASSSPRTWASASTSSLTGGVT
ncbi:DUF1587 domain-containing protein [Prosthecobacter sp. SYSU 5D2]|uniref:DUF1587 domain-containing protein n=1 Tax=Prosthecobacter sp. SYSU 5D2 TaxID=3134134 RepID=UPI0031FEB375